MSDARIEDHAVIGDTHTTALIERGGSIDWLCWPRHDSPALFLRILDGERGGFCDLVLDDLIKVSRRYLPRTNILETSFRTASGLVVLTDLMPVHPPATLADEGPDGEGESRILRLLECRSGRVRGRFRVRPTPDYARVRPTAGLVDDAVVFAAPDWHLRVDCSHPLQVEGDLAVAAWSLRAGEHAHLSISHDGAGLPDGIADPQLAQDRLQATRRYWEGWSDRCTYAGPHAEMVLRSILCLKLLTYSPSGAIIAAASVGLPEAVPGNRNYDYRYSWLRDASFTVTSFVKLGYTREAAEYLRFLREAEPSRGRELKLLYGIAGTIAPVEELDHLAGWRGVGPVSIGNEAAGQSQHDIYGEFLMALHAWLEAVDYQPPQRVDDHLPEVVTNLAERALAERDQPDHGIWEFRTGKRHFLHTKALIHLALVCAVAIGERIGRIDQARIARWRDAAAEIRAEYHAQAWSTAKQAYVQAYDGEELDASVLRVALFGAIDPTDPRLRSTLAAIERELGAGDLLHRYRMDDGMAGTEGTFTACAFWRVGCLALAGETRKATAIFERLLARANDVGLFAEEIDAATGEQRGNFPQAFTHMAVINHALRLQEVIDGEAGA